MNKDKKDCIEENRFIISIKPKKNSLQVRYTKKESYTEQEELLLIALGCKKC